MVFLWIFVDYRECVKIHKNLRKNTNFGWSGVQIRPQIGPQMAPKTAQEAPKTAQEAPKTAQEATKSAQEAPKTAEKAPRRSKKAARGWVTIGRRSGTTRGPLEDRSFVGHGSWVGD